MGEVFSERVPSSFFGGVLAVKAIPEKHRFAAILGGAGLMHLLWALFGVVPPLISDAATLNEAATNLATGHGFQTAGKMITNYTPGWPAILAFFYMIFGAHLVVLCLLNASMIVGTAALLGRLTASWMGERAGLVVTFFVGTFPPLFFYQNTANGESAVIFLSSAFLFLALAKTPRVWDPPVIGATLGLLALTKPELVLWGAALPLAEIFRDFGAKDRVGKSFGQKVMMALRTRRMWVAVPIAAAVSLVFVLGWIQRNSNLVGRRVPISSTSGYAIWQTAHEPQLFEQNQDLFDAWARCDGLPGPHDDFARDACLQAEGKGFVMANPPLFLKKAVRNVPRMLFGSHTEIYPPLGAAYGTHRAEGAWGKLVIKLGLFAYWTAIVGLGFVGIVRLRKYALFWPVIYALAVKVVAHAILFATPRYGLHLLPFFMLGLGTFFVPKKASKGGDTAPAETPAEAPAEATSAA